MLKIINQDYQHYKGGYYKELYEAKHSETGEYMVIYTDGREVWARPYAMFHGYAQVDGKSVRRFRPVAADEVVRKLPRGHGKGFA